MSDPSLPAKYTVSKYSPSTFEDRGAAAPFTTPALSSARVRLDDRHNLVLLTPGFAGTEAVYVLPWAGIPELFTMTVHDRALYEAILEKRATAPSAIRREALRVMASGLAGPEAREVGRRAIESDDAFSLEIQAVLLISLLFALRVDVSGLMGLDFTRSEVVIRARHALTSAVTPLGVDPDTAYERMGQLAETLSFLGLPNFGNPGRLRLLMDQLKTFQQTMEHKADRAIAEAASFHRFAAEVAGMTLGLARSSLRALDGFAGDLPHVVQYWSTLHPQIQSLANRLSWLLDGWDYVLAFAKGMDTWDSETFWENIETLARMLPMIPRDEIQEQKAVGARYAETMQRRRVMAMQDWRTGVLDRELVSRLELAKIHSS